MFQFTISVYYFLKVPQCEILINWILMIFFIMRSLYIGRVLKG
jgi:hypothetical protein